MSEHHSAHLEEQFKDACKVYLLRLDYNGSGIFNDVEDQIIALLRGEQNSEENLLAPKDFSRHGIPNLDALKVAQFYDHTDQLYEQMMKTLEVMFEAYLASKVEDFLYYIAQQKQEIDQHITRRRKYRLASVVMQEMARYLALVIIEKLQPVIGANDHPEAYQN